MTDEKQAIQRVVDAVFDVRTDADRTLLDALDVLVVGRQFDEFGRAVFRALVQRRLAALVGRRTIAVARLSALLRGKMH